MIQPHWLCLQLHGTCYCMSDNILFHVQTVLFYCSNQCINDIVSTINCPAGYIYQVKLGLIHTLLVGSLKS